MTILRLLAFIAPLSLESFAVAAALAAVGGWLLLDGDEDDETTRLASAHGLALLGLGLSISLDKLAIGFTLGLVRLPVVAVLVAIAVQAFVVAQLGLTLGARISKHLQGYAHRGAAIVLIVLGAGLALSHLLR